MIDPMGVFRVRWDALVILVLVYIMLVAPFTICFGIEYGWLEPLGLIDLTIDVLFAFDIYLNFRTGVVGGRSSSANGCRPLAGWVMSPAGSPLHACSPYVWVGGQLLMHCRRWQHPSRHPRADQPCSAPSCC
jgi:hypothetical protein